MKYLIALVLIGIGYGCIRYYFELTRMFGRIEFAERYLGVGRTYLAWRMLGVLFILAAAILLRFWTAIFG